MNGLVRYVVFARRLTVWNSPMSYSVNCMSYLQLIGGGTGVKAWLLECCAVGISREVFDNACQKHVVEGMEVFSKYRVVNKQTRSILDRFIKMTQCT